MTASIKDLDRYIVINQELLISLPIDPSNSDSRITLLSELEKAFRTHYRITKSPNNLQGIITTQHQLHMEQTIAAQDKHNAIEQQTQYLNVGPSPMTRGRMRSCSHGQLDPNAQLPMNPNQYAYPGQVYPNAPPMIPNANYAQAQMNAAAQQAYYNQIQNANNAAMLDVGSARLKRR